MKRARHNGRLIEAGPDAPERAECPHCGAEVELRFRSNMDRTKTWFWRHRPSEGRGCRRRARIPGVYIIPVEEDDL